MKYCKDTTEKHIICKNYPNKLETLQSIFRTEGYNATLFSDETGVNLDKIEIERCKGTTGRQATMDFAIGISHEGKKRQMLLVELKFNVKNPANVTKADIDNKIRHSIELLSHQPPIANFQIIIFQDNQLSVARSYIARLYGKPPKEKILVKSAKEFKNDYFD